jgi:hypothetical protein
VTVHRGGQTGGTPGNVSPPLLSPGAPPQPFVRRPWFGPRAAFFAARFPTLLARLYRRLSVMRTGRWSRAREGATPLAGRSDSLAPTFRGGALRGVAPSLALVSE